MSKRAQPPLLPLKRFPWTAGPWRIDDRRESPGGALQVQAEHRGSGSSYCVATVNLWDAPQANAHLISAAPDLFEALQLADATLLGVNMNRNVVERKVRAALAKARGGV